MSDIFVFPSIVWKIQDLTTYCKIKSSPFLFSGERYRLKFVYNKNTAGADTYWMTLKGSGTKLPCNINVSSWYVIGENRHFEKFVQLQYSKFNEYFLWEETSSVIYNTFKSPYHNFDIKKFWNESFFVISFTPTKILSTDVLQEQQKEDFIVLDSSPCITSLCHDFEKCFNSQEMSDVILISGDQKIFAHRTILSARSDVFAAMFRNHMKESKEQKAVDMTDMDYSVLEQLLRYIYSGKAHLSHDNVHQLYAAANKYAVEALKMKCAMFMVENPETAITPEVSEVASNVSDLCTKDSVLSHFAYVKAVLSTEEWKKLSEAEPKFAHEAFIFLVSKSPC